MLEKLFSVNSKVTKIRKKINTSIIKLFTVRSSKIRAIMIMIKIKKIYIKNGNNYIIENIATVSLR